VPYPAITPDPDFARLDTVLRGGVPDRVPLFEWYVEHPILLAVREAPFAEDLGARWRELAELWRGLGYDYLPASVEIPLPAETLTAESARGDQNARQWVPSAHGVIETWEDLDRYPWPTPEQVGYYAVEHAAAALPEGMKVVAKVGGAVFGNALRIMGFAPLCYAVADDPDLFAAVCTRIGKVQVAVVQALASHDAVGAIAVGGDMGYRSQTIIAPDLLRAHVLPWLQRFAEAAHARGKPLALHSCGNLTAIMDDLVTWVGIDGKHSFEDAITPVTEAKRRWGDRLALLGGIDTDLLARGTPEQVRARTREVLEGCMPGGGFALGSGCSITDYTPLPNYVAMIEEGRRLGVYV